MDYDTLKDQWSEVEDRDGIRLSWNTFPSSRMVFLQHSIACDGWAYIVPPGSLEACCSHWGSLHSLKRKARHPTITLRTHSMQSSMSSSAQPVCVCHFRLDTRYSRLTNLGPLILELGCGSAHFVCHAMHFPLTIKISRRIIYLRSFILRAQRLSINFPDQRQLLQSLSTSWTLAKRKIA